MRRGPFLILFAVSGAAALIYEVVWTRLLTLYLGHGLAAASAVLAAFMGGLALGAGAAGRRAARYKPATALRVYAALEIAIGVIALMLPLALMAARPLLAASYADGAGGGTFAFLRVAISVLLLCVPAACMGATFPIASRWMVRTASTAAQDAGALYAANTLGAAAGAILAGFTLIPALGLSGTTYVGIALNVIAAAGAYLMSRSVGDVEDTSMATAEAVALRTSSLRTSSLRTSSLRTSSMWLAATALGVSGFASLTLQVVWTRLLVQILGPTTYAFSIVVSIFIVGIAGGAAIAARLSRRVPAGVGLASALLLSAGLALAASSAVDWSLLTIADIVSRQNYDFNDVLRREVMLVTALLLPMTLAFGAAFPFAVALATNRDESVIERIGVIYAVNTVGAILGALLSGFVLIPRLGLHGTIQLVAALALVIAVVILFRTARASARWAGFALAAAVAVAIAAAPEWDRSLLSSGAYKYAPAMRGSNLHTALTAGELLSYQEGSTGTVAVRRLTGTTSLAIDGKVDASNAGDMLTQRLLAHMPLLLHPDPKRIAILGLGSGVTLGSALTHPLEEATVLEISPGVVDASKFFETENHNALNDPRTRLIVSDAA